MIKLRVLELLEEQNHSKYWLFKRLDMTYQNYSNMILNKTASIKYENIEKLCEILDCEIQDLFQKVDEEGDTK